jgi:two-component system sensor histidine kinase/response regulator
MSHAGREEDKMCSSFQGMNMAQTIVVVEDDKDVRDTMVAFLTSEGYCVAAFENGAQALKGMKDVYNPGLILLDLMMPGMDGWEFLEARRFTEVKNTPVYVVSASLERGPDRHRGLPGIVGYLKKPFSIEALVDAVERHIAPMMRAA